MGFGNQCQHPGVVAPDCSLKGHLFTANRLTLRRFNASKFQRFNASLAHWYNNILEQVSPAKPNETQAQAIINQRLNRTRLEVARAQQQAAALGFQAALLNAGREVSDALSRHQTALDKVRVHTQQMTALQQSVAYLQELLQAGFATCPELITARQSLLQAELNSVNDRLQRLQAVVTLCRSLAAARSFATRTPNKDDGIFDHLNSFSSNPGRNRR